MTLLMNISSSEATVGGGRVLTPSLSYPEWVPAALCTLGMLVLSCLPEAQPVLTVSNTGRRNSTSTPEVFAQLVKLGSKLEMGSGDPIGSSFLKGPLEMTT